MLNARHIAALIGAIFVLETGSAQDRTDLMSEVMVTSPGRERAQKLMEIAAHELEEGRTRYAIEFSILGSAEAEKHGLENEMAQAQLDLAKAHIQKGDLDNAVKACTRVTRMGSARQNGARNKALLQLAEIHVAAGHPQKALEYLSDPELSRNVQGGDRSRYISSMVKARAVTLSPNAFLGHCLNILEEVGPDADNALRAEILSQLATARSNMGKYEEALQTEEQVLALAIAMGKPLEAGISANNIGELNQRLGRMEESLKAYAKGLIMVEDVPQLRMNMEANAALAHARYGNSDIGLRLINDAIGTARKLNSNGEMPKLLRTKAAIRHMMGDVEIALDKALEALHVAAEAQLLDEQLLSSSLVAALYKHNGLLAEARIQEKKHRALMQRAETVQKEEKLAKEAHLIRLQRVEVEQMEQWNREQHKESHLRQLKLDAENHEKQLALLIYEKQLESSARREASLANDQALKELALIQAALEAERQQRMIQELENNRMLQTLDVAKLEAEQSEQRRNMEILQERAQLMEAESRTLEAEQKHQRNAIRFYIILAASTFFLAVFLLTAWLNARRKKRTIWRQNQQISSINERLEEKDKNIQSSLTYARTIQSAILPTEQMLQSIIPESFLFYRPLDKVSGDLPFMKRVGDVLYLAAIDCTGHGVPAAMMTFIAYYGLNELIDKDPRATSAELLDRLHEHVRNTMADREDTVLYNDGMDIGLCQMDLKTGHVVFAGAQLSLFLVRNSEILRFKGDVLPIGDDQFERKNGYTDHEVELTPGDSIFLFSDGIIHQFGGPDGRKKLSIRRLNELLGLASKQHLIEIKENTEKLFEQWKGDTPQTDDVLMIGMRYAA